MNLTSEDIHEIFNGVSTEEISAKKLIIDLYEASRLVDSWRARRDATSECPDAHLHRRTVRPGQVRILPTGATCSTCRAYSHAAARAADATRERNHILYLMREQGAEWSYESRKAKRVRVR